MRKYKKVMFLALAAILAGSLAIAAPGKNKGKFRKSEKHASGEYIVVFNDDVNPADVTSNADDLSRLHGGVVRHVFRSAIRGFSVRLTEKKAQELSNDPRVAYVEEDGIVTANSVQNSPPWGLDRVDQRDLPLSGSYDDHGNNGSGVTAFIIDTGIRTSHQEFSGRAYVGADFIGDGLNGQDGYGHGTHVAGTIGGQTYGVAKGVSLCAVRVLNSTGNGTVSQVIAGIDWVTANHSGPSVANMSLGGPASDSEDQALRNSISSGVVFVVAAGNSADDASNYSPARVTEAITVSATDSGDTRASFANYGSVVDIFAPGVDILSAWKDSDTATNIISGTSMATPHVAGVVALYLKAHPGDSPSTVATALTNSSSPGRVNNPGPGSPNCLVYETGFSLPPPPPSGPIFKIMNVNSGLALEVEYDSTTLGAWIDQWPYVSATSQQWSLVDVGGGAYKIINVNSGLALEVWQDSLLAEARIDQWPYVSATSQQWRLEDAGGGAYKIINVNSGLALEVWQDSVQPQAYMDQYPYVGATSQHWRLEPVN